MIRVARNHAYIVFDILSEECFDDEMFKRWLDSGQTHPTLLCKSFVVDFFLRHGFSLKGEFFNEKYNVGKSLYLIFGRSASLEVDDSAIIT
jgi:hypothetical protein